jgi:hypothetical protein
MSRKRAAWLLVSLTAMLAGLILFIVYNQGSRYGLKDPAAALAFVGGASIVIERIIETMWTSIAGLGGAYWPLNLISKQVTTMVDELNQAVQPVYDNALKAIDEVATAEGWTAAQIAAAKTEVASLSARFTQLKDELPSANERVNLLIAATAQHVEYLKKKYANATVKLDATVGVANATINGLQNFMATFKDNPGRRLISIYVGVMLGLAVAGYFGLDLFQAVLSEQAANATPIARNVILTGVVIGLGSSPTHEVIRAVQEYKKARKGENLATPDLAM